ncbi:LysR substrate-binding domain-containing protein [Tianweitania sediminis]|uniref:LysR family transcriptional regulator n=1 Tax=Tianweitania sediminis TaxID=1502156 RepID=A0A8J7UJT8_9HYPH|nr:LysR substrate-binding domain-containing protein [Tianweitania sediminis]MBP0438989.1 LysR family transcriptional regulator [Tianweitania sediminis]
MPNEIANLPLAALRVFEAAARLLSFTRAAEDLRMTQAAVSYQIKVLEERVGAPLFLRKPRHVELTEVGARLAPIVSDAFERLRSGYDEARGETRSVLAVTSTSTFASHWLAPRIGLFQLQHPQIAVRLDTENRARDFTREQVDVGIRGGYGVWPGVAAHKLLPITFTPMASPALLHRLGTPKRPSDILQMPIIDTSDIWWRLWFKHVGIAEDSLESHPQNDLGAQSMTSSAALAGRGVAILTPLFFQEALASGALVQLFPDLGSDGQHYWLVYAQARRNIAKIKAFRDWLLDQFEPSLT